MSKPEAVEGDKIAKVMAHAGLCSRRDAERWVTAKRVKVNGVVIESPAIRVTSKDTVLVDDKPLPGKSEERLWLYHKPKGVMTTHKDPQGRPTVFSQLPSELPRVISVGRLDLNTEGLLLLTTDGALSRHLEHPSTGFVRSYRVRVHGKIDTKKLETLTHGVTVDGVRYGPVEWDVTKEGSTNSWLLLSIKEGKNREVRNLMSHIGLQVNRLIRTTYGPFQLGNLPIGAIKEIPHSMIKRKIGTW